MAALRTRGVRDAALLIADNASGDVLAYVGSSGSLSSAAQVDGARARRQAGSTLKPFLSGLAIERRLLTAATRLDDAPLEIPVAGGGLFRPRNYDDVFRGPVSVRTALAGSLNVPAVRALQLVGVDDFADRLRTLGFDDVRQPGGYYGPALALGSAEVTLWQLVDAYRALANGGVRSSLRLSAADDAGNAPRRVLDPAAAFVVADILADRDGRAVTFGLESPLATRFWAAVKTGTSTDMRDNWCVGFSRRYTVGVWVGNAGGAPMRDVSGVTGAAPIWAEMMDWLHRDAANPPPPAPRGVERVRHEWYLPGTAPAAAVARPASAPRILAPTDGTVIAIDPDIAAPRQRLVLEAAGAAGLRWLVDDADLGDAGAPVLWSLMPGTHEVALADAAGHHLASARFSVRGSPLAP
jgi:penicillin-binding protein 1C